jgi:O-antigen biosynthesis protein
VNGAGVSRLVPVSVIIPTRDRADLLTRCVRGVRERTAYPDIELLVVDNDSRCRDALACLETLNGASGVRVLRHPGAFNFAAICNRAAAQARGEVLVFLNNDTDVIDGGWLAELASLARDPRNGCVGAKLLFGDGSIQHAGIRLGGRAVAANACAGCPRDGGGHGDLLRDRRTVSAVSAACLAIRRQLYLELGGMDESLPVAYNDVDLCLAAEAVGYRNLFTPFAELYHLEGQSRGRTRTLRQWFRLLRDRRYLRRKWGARLDSDPWLPSPHDCG